MADTGPQRTKLPNPPPSDKFDHGTEWRGGAHLPYEQLIWFVLRMPALPIKGTI